MILRPALGLAAALSVFLAGIGSAAALDYPTRTVKWIVPYPPGGSTDVLARIMSQWFSEKMGQSFVIENKAGGGNNIGVELVVKAAPDGYTMLLVNPANGINTTLYKNLPFNFLTDIAPVAGLVRAPNVMEVNEKANAETNRALADPKMQARLAQLGGKPIIGTPADFGKVIAAETAKWAKVVISSGAKVE